MNIGEIFDLLNSFQDKGAARSLFVSRERVPDVVYGFCLSAQECGLDFSPLRFECVTSKDGLKEKLDNKNPIGVVFSENLPDDDTPLEFVKFVRSIRLDVDLRLVMILAVDDKGGFVMEKEDMIHLLRGRLTNFIVPPFSKEKVSRAIKIFEADEE